MPSNRLGDAPIQRQYAEQMQEVASLLDRVFNGNAVGNERQTGFILLVFPFGDVSTNARCNYISNGADRRDVVALFKEQIARFEGQPEMKGTA